MESNTIDAKAQSMGYVVLLAITTAISGFLFGFDTAVINGVLLFLRRQFDLSNLQTEIAASSLLLGCLLGAAGASMVRDRYGRKKSLIFSAILFALSALGAAAANSVALFSVARLLGGLAIGLASALTPVYIAEISPSKNRGTLVSLNQLAIVIGILAAYLVNWRLSRLGDASWRWMLAVAAVPSLAFLLGVATFWQRASATSQTERGASGLDQHGRASTARNAPRGKLPAAVTLPRPWVRSSASRNVPSCL